MKHLAVAPGQTSSKGGCLLPARPALVVTRAALPRSSQSLAQPGRPQHVQLSGASLQVARGSHSAGRRSVFVKAQEQDMAKFAGASSSTSSSPPTTISTTSEDSSLTTATATTAPLSSAMPSPPAATIDMTTPPPPAAATPATAASVSAAHTALNRNGHAIACVLYSLLDRAPTAKTAATAAVDSSSGGPSTAVSFPELFMTALSQERLMDRVFDPAVLGEQVHDPSRAGCAGATATDLPSDLRSALQLLQSQLSDNIDALTAEAQRLTEASAAAAKAAASTGSDVSRHRGNASVAGAFSSVRSSSVPGSKASRSKDSMDAKDSPKAMSARAAALRKRAARHRSLLAHAAALLVRPTQDHALSLAEGLQLAVLVGLRPGWTGGGSGSTGSSGEKRNGRRQRILSADGLTASAALDGAADNCLTDDTAVSEARVVNSKKAESSAMRSSQMADNSGGGAVTQQQSGLDEEERAAWRAVADEVSASLRRRLAESDAARAALEAQLADANARATATQAQAAAAAASNNSAASASSYPGVVDAVVEKALESALSEMSKASGDSSLSGGADQAAAVAGMVQNILKASAGEVLELAQALAKRAAEGDPWAQAMVGMQTRIMSELAEAGVIGGPVSNDKVSDSGSKAVGSASDATSRTAVNGGSEQHFPEPGDRFSSRIRGSAVEGPRGSTGEHSAGRGGNWQAVDPWFTRSSAPRPWRDGGQHGEQAADRCEAYSREHVEALRGAVVTSERKLAATEAALASTGAKLGYLRAEVAVVGKELAGVVTGMPVMWVLPEVGRLVGQMRTSAHKLRELSAHCAELAASVEGPSDQPEAPGGGGRSGGGGEGSGNGTATSNAASNSNSGMANGSSGTSSGSGTTNGSSSTSSGSGGAAGQTSAGNVGGGTNGAAFGGGDDQQAWKGAGPAVNPNNDWQGDSGSARGSGTMSEGDVMAAMQLIDMLLSSGGSGGGAYGGGGGGGRYGGWGRRNWRA